MQFGAFVWTSLIITKLPAKPNPLYIRTVLMGVIGLFMMSSNCIISFHFKQILLWRHKNFLISVLMDFRNFGDLINRNKITDKHKYCHIYNCMCTADQHSFMSVFISYFCSLYVRRTEQIPRAWGDVIL